MQELQKIEEIPAFLEPVKIAINLLVDKVNEQGKLSGDEGRTITIENGVIRCTLQTSSGLGGYSEDAEYKGLFAGINTSGANALKISIIDGYSADEDICGYVYIDDFYPVDAVADLAVSTSGYAILTIDATNGDVVTSITFASDFESGSENDIVKIPLIYVNVVADDAGHKSIADIQQLQYGIVYLDLLKFPSLITDYDDTKKMALIIDNGNYKFIEIGDCI